MTAMCLVTGRSGPTEGTGSWSQNPQLLPMGNTKEIRTMRYIQK